MKEIKDFNPWYQKIDFGNGVFSPGRRECGEVVWKGIVKYLLPPTLEDMKILDLGCNAGLFCVRSALLGASATGIEKSEHWYRQALFVRGYFEKLYRKKLDVTYLCGDVQKVIGGLSGEFDLVFAISVLYYMREGEEKFIDKLCSLTDWVICGYRKGQREKQFSQFFAERGFDRYSDLMVDVKTGRYLVSYKRGRHDPY